MMQCPICNTDNWEIAVFCQNCGNCMNFNNDITHNQDKKPDLFLYSPQFLSLYKFRQLKTIRNTHNISPVSLKFDNQPIYSKFRISNKTYALGNISIIKDKLIFRGKIWHIIPVNKVIDFRDIIEIEIITTSIIDNLLMIKLSNKREYHFETIDTWAKDIFEYISEIIYK